MCGIVGYIGRRQAQPLVVNCLARLEYRGYDSCGVAIANGGIEVHKDAVRVEALRRSMPKFTGTTGIGHTRWATHGGVSQVNAHPHLDCQGRIAVVHNGIIHNYASLRRKLAGEGHVFVSETDSEVIPHLIEKYYRGNLEEAVQATLRELEGSYALIAMMAGQAKLVAARKDSPLIIGLGDKENFIASDVPAILDYTNRVMYLEEGDVSVVTPERARVRADGREVAREEHKILWGVEQAQKSGYEHYMLKEIHEQPRVIRDTLGEYTQAAEAGNGLAALRDIGTESMLILACGTSYHAGLVGKYLIEELLGIPVRAELASEFNYYGQALGKMAIVITQSGETADTLRAVRRLRKSGCQVLAVTNVVGSTASRIADRVVYTRAGPEMSVAATKSFLAQLMVLYWLTVTQSGANARRLADLRLELRQLPTRVQQVLDAEEKVRDCARDLARYRNVFFIGRGINYPVALEGALKLKEISYIHAEGCAAGELKHGPFALLGKDTPVVAVVSQDSTYDPVLTNIKEIKARGSPVIVVAAEGDENVDELADTVLSVPRLDPLLSPVVNTVVLQLLAYYAARELGCPIDFPRNLAKSVTVE